MLLVSFEDVDPKVSQIAVNEVLDAYEDYGVESEIQLDGKKTSLLRNHLVILQDRLEDIQEEVDEISKDYGNDLALMGRYQQKFQELMKLEVEQSVLELQLVDLRAKTQQGQPGRGVDDAPLHAHPLLHAHDRLARLAVAQRDGGGSGADKPHPLGRG